MYVSKEKYQQEWEMERLCNNVIHAYVYNLDEKFGEIGSVMLDAVNNTLTANV